MNDTAGDLALGPLGAIGLLDQGQRYHTRYHIQNSYWTRIHAFARLHLRLPNLDPSLASLGIVNSLVSFNTTYY